MTRDANPLARHGGLSYLEIPADDPARSASFYREVAGWTLDPRGPGDVRFSDAGGQMIGRWVTGRAPVREPGVMLYFYVDDIAAAVARAGATGGAVVEPPRAEGDTLVARVRDPAGNLIGLWQFA